MGRDGSAEVTRFESEAGAKKYAAAQRRLIRISVLVEIVLGWYELHMREKGNKPGSVTETIRRLNVWLPSDLLLSELSEKSLQETYDRRCKAVATDTHRNELAEIKSFFRWCVEKRKLLKQSPAEGIEPKGKRRRGKPQLRRGEAQKISALALELALAGDEGAVAVLMILWLGLRSSEVRLRTVRDVDVTPEGTWLWIDSGKTDAAKRHMELPELLAGLLQVRCKGKLPGAYLFPADARGGVRSATWLRKVVARLCKRAKVPVVPPHGLRGTWATLAEDVGAVGHLVAAQL